MFVRRRKNKSGADVMSNYVGIFLIVQSQEDLDKIAARAIELRKELNREDGAKLFFEPCDYLDNKYCLSVDTLSKYPDEIHLSYKIANGIAHSYPDMNLSLVETWEGPVSERAISKYGWFFWLEQALDENGCRLFDEDGNALFIEPEEWGMYDVIDGEGIIPEGATKIEEFGFWYRDNLKHVVIPPSVKAIGRYAFARCTNLESIVIPPSVTEIGEGAFLGSGIKEFEIPETVTKVGHALFEIKPPEDNHDTDQTQGCDELPF